MYKRQGCVWVVVIVTFPLPDAFTVRIRGMAGTSPTVKLSVSLSEALRHITLVAFLIIILDAFTCRVEVKLEFRGVPLLSVREAVKGLRTEMLEIGELAVYLFGIMSGLRHSRELDPNTRQVNVTWSPGHVNLLSLLEVSSTFCP